MFMSNWVVAADKDSVSEGNIVPVKAGGQPIVLVCVEGVVYALYNQCPHLGCAMHRGKLSGHYLICPCHDWVFDIRTGSFTAAPEIQIQRFPVKVEGAKILVNTGGSVE